MMRSLPTTLWISSALLDCVAVAILPATLGAAALVAAPDATASEPDRECAIAHSSPLSPQPSEDQLNYRARLHSFATGEGVKVAVIDTGVATHDQLRHLSGGADLIAPEEPEPHRDCDLHGTVVAGIIAGHDIGIAPRAEIYAVRQTSAHYRQEREDDTTGSLDTLAEAIDDAADAGARIINISVVSCVPPDVAALVDTSRLDGALAHAEESGSVVIAASGNASSGSCEMGDRVFPADSPTVLSVSAQADSHELADYSLNSADGPQLAAQGFVPLALNPAGGWADGKEGTDGTSQFHGTSFAAPVVSGTAALLAQRFPDDSPAALRKRLEDAAEPGHGFVDPLTVLTHVESSTHGDTRAMAIRPAEKSTSHAPMRSAWVLGGLALALAAWATWRGLRSKS